MKRLQQNVGTPSRLRNRTLGATVGQPGTPTHSQRLLETPTSRHETDSNVLPTPSPGGPPNVFPVSLGTGNVGTVPLSVVGAVRGSTAVPQDTQAHAAFDPRRRAHAASHAHASRDGAAGGRP